MEGGHDKNNTWKKLFSNLLIQLNVAQVLPIGYSFMRLCGLSLMLTGRISLALHHPSFLLQMEDSDEEEREDEESDEFDIMPPFSEKDSSAESGARGSGAAGRAAPVMTLMLLPTLLLDRERWSYWSLLLLRLPPLPSSRPLSSYSFKNPSLHSERATKDICEEENAQFSFHFLSFFQK